MAMKAHPASQWSQICRTWLVLYLGVLAVNPVFCADAPKGADVKTPSAANSTNSPNNPSGSIQVVDATTHEFRFYRDARVEVAIKKDGGWVGKPFELFLSAAYTDAAKSTRMRRITGYAAEPEWDARNQSILYQLILEDNVRVDIYYQVKGGVLYTGFSVKEPASISFPGGYRVQCNQPDLLPLDAAGNLYKGWLAPEGVASEKLATLLKGMQVSVKCKKSALMNYPYSKSIPRFASDGIIEDFTIAGVYEKRVISFDLPASNGELGTHIYPGNAPFQGYAVFFSKKDQQHPATTSSEWMRLTVK